MMDKRLAKVLAFGVFLAFLIVPAIALASEGAAVVGSDAVEVAKHSAAAMSSLAAGLAMGISALGAAYAQAKIGSAAAGTLAERPEVAIWVITLQALPEVIVLLGFVSAIMIKG